MLAIHDQFTHQMRNRLKTTGMGLGLVRLLQDAGRFEEARTTLSSLENGFQGVAEESDKPSQEPGETELVYTVSLSGSPGISFAALATPPCHFPKSPCLV